MWSLCRRIFANRSIYKYSPEHLHRVYQSWFQFQDKPNFPLLSIGMWETKPIDQNLIITLEIFEFDKNQLGVQDQVQQPLIFMEQVSSYNLSYFSQSHSHTCLILNDDIFKKKTNYLQSFGTPTEKSGQNDNKYKEKKDSNPADLTLVLVFLPLPLIFMEQINLDTCSCWEITFTFARIPFDTLTQENVHAS